MEVVGAVASGLTLVDAAARLAQTCFRLYEFWDSMCGAPEEVKYILNDLRLVGNILRDISHQKELVPSVSMVLEACVERLSELEALVREFDAGFSATNSRNERLWTAFKFTGKTKKVQKFRKSLSEAKQTLMLGLMYQNIQRPRLAFTNQDVQFVSVVAPPSRDAEEQLRNPILTKGADSVDVTPDAPPPAYSAAGSPPTPAAPPTADSAHQADKDTMAAVVSRKAMQTILQASLHMAVDNLFASGTVQQLMDSTLDQVTSFESTTSGTYSADGYDLRQGVPTHRGRNGAQDEEMSPPLKHGGPILTRSRVCHQTSSMGVVLGSIWVRTSTLKVEEGSSKAGGRAEVITSFIFYPASWLTRVGLGYGTEASLKFSAAGGWKFNFVPIRAVPEDSLIFDLCRRGETSAVKLMLGRGDASVKDTSPKGWSPLHFAAAFGHVDVCAALIEAGADKTALAYEGPTQNTLSPVTMFAESALSIPAGEKIRMLRLFADTMDLTDPSGDGWTVITSLVKALEKESVSMTDCSITWFMRVKGTEPIVACGAKTLWDCLQHAVRSFLFHEKDGQIFQGLLELDSGGEEDAECIGAGMQSQTTALARWFALRASQRDLLPMIVEVGRLLKIEGFDWVEDRITPRDYCRALPAIYAAWCKVFPNEIERLRDLVAAELDQVLGELHIDRELLKKAMHVTGEEVVDYSGQAKVCGGCGDSYVKLGAGLVQPRLIAFSECRRTGHKAECECSAFLRQTGLDADDLRDTDSGLSEDESDADEEFPAESDDALDRLCETYDGLHLQDAGTDPFQDAATLLYRAQARRWLGSYRHDEALCATCFLERERYLGEEGYTPVPETYGAYAIGYEPASTMEK